MVYYVIVHREAVARVAQSVVQETRSHYHPEVIADLNTHPSILIAAPTMNKPDKTNGPVARNWAPLDLERNLANWLPATKPDRVQEMVFRTVGCGKNGRELRQP